MSLHEKFLRKILGIIPRAGIFIKAEMITFDKHSGAPQGPYLI